MTIARAVMATDGSWVGRGACRVLDPEDFFAQGADQQKIKIVCAECPVRTECLADALDNRIEFGVWGGMTERERRRVLREHPEVRDWFRVLDRARGRDAAERAAS